MSLSNILAPNNEHLYCDILNANTLNVTNENITNLTVTNLTATTANITTGNITTLNVTNPKTDYQVWVPAIDMNVDVGGTTWNKTVDTVAGVHYLKNVASAGTSTIYTDITQMFRTSANKGLQLTSLTYIYSVATQDLTSITGFLFLNEYVESNTVQTSNITLTGSALPVAQNDPFVYVRNRPLLTTSYQASNTIYTLETTFVTQAATSVKFYGIILNFSANWY